MWVKLKGACGAKGGMLIHINPNIFCLANPKSGTGLMSLHFGF